MLTIHGEIGLVSTFVNAICTNDLLDENFTGFCDPPTLHNTYSVLTILTSKFGIRIGIKNDFMLENTDQSRHFSDLDRRPPIDPDGS